MLRFGKRSGIGYTKRFAFASFGWFVVILGHGSFQDLLDAFELEDRHAA